MHSYTVAEYFDAGCKDMNVRSMLAVHHITGGKVCDTGCGRFNNGACASYKNLTLEKPTNIEPVETVKAEASRRGVSIKTVRTQRRDARLSAKSGGAS